MDGSENSLPLTDENDLAFCAGDCRIKQIPAQHDVMFLQKRDDYCRELSALRFMDGNAIGQIQVLHIIAGVEQFTTVNQCDFNQSLTVFINPNRIDDANITI